MASPSELETGWKENGSVNRKDPQTPMGTVILIIVFFFLTLGLWFNAYFLMLSRGVSQ